jgi:hypothetical protein
MTQAIQATLDECQWLKEEDISICELCDGSGEIKPDHECSRCFGTGVGNFEDLKGDHENKPCLVCGVPLLIHNTCCGWGNANTTTLPDGTITDRRHPGYGQNLSLWRMNYVQEQFKR